MTIWELEANEEYNNAFLVDENDERILESGKYFKEIQDSPQTRLISIDVTSKGFPDIMNYWGVSGSCIVSTRLKALLVREFGNLNIQFIPCIEGYNPSQSDKYIGERALFHSTLIPNSEFTKNQYTFIRKQLINGFDAQFRISPEKSSD